MTPAELAMVIFMVCGRGFGKEVVEKCRDTIVNCAVDKDSKIEKKQVEVCVKRAKAEL